jgi:hypothetical protein
VPLPFTNCSGVLVPVRLLASIVPEGVLLEATEEATLLLEELLDATLLFEELLDATLEAMLLDATLLFDDELLATLLLEEELLATLDEELAVATGPTEHQALIPKLLVGKADCVHRKLPVFVAYTKEPLLPRATVCVPLILQVLPTCTHFA